MEVIVEHLGAVQFEIKARGHIIVTDQPRENGGFDEGMTPPELLLASLGSCAAFYAAQYLRKRAWGNFIVALSGWYAGLRGEEGPPERFRRDERAWKGK